MVLHINSCHDDYSAGVCYEQGTGVAQNLEEAVRYYKLAADQGDAGAQKNLGESCNAF
jgi:TPR repeat protein